MSNSIIKSLRVDATKKFPELGVYYFLDGNVMLCVNGSININVHVDAQHARAFAEAILEAISAPAVAEPEAV